MSKRWAMLLVTFAAAALSGCQSTKFPTFGRGQGSSRYQRYEAQRFDPYPDTDISNNSIKTDGMRPRDFVDPPAEPTRARWWQFGRYRWSPDAGQ